VALWGLALLMLALPGLRWLRKRRSLRAAHA